MLTRNTLNLLSSIILDVAWPAIFLDSLGLPVEKYLLELSLFPT